MDLARQADRVLRYMMSGADPTLRSGSGPSPSAPGVAALQAICEGDFATAATRSAEALAGARDPDALTLARAVAGLSIAHLPDAIQDPLLVDPRTGGDVLAAAIDDPQRLDPELRAPLGSLLAEAALALARIDLAATLFRAFTIPAELFGRADHPYLTFIRVLGARIAAFHAEISLAQRLADEAVAGAGSPIEVVLARATSALVRGNANERAATREVIDLVAAGGLAPTDMVTRGCYVLAAYGAAALGDRSRASRLILEAGGPGLELLRIVDRVLGLELLVAAAVDDQDADAADAWMTVALALEDHSIAAPIVGRIKARVALLGGDPVSAIHHAAGARAGAAAEGRNIEAAEAAILLARARIGSHGGATAARDLAEAADQARDSGHLAFLRAASRELRGVGRRLPPESASGWDGLSMREREVATLVAEGFGNAAIAAALFLSEHTVRIHVSRVLHAFGVSSRSGVAIALAPTVPLDAPSLTTRQAQVVAHVTAGSSNRQIADALGIGVSTVEKHVGAIMRRWGVRSRSAIIRVARASPDVLAG